MAAVRRIAGDILRRAVEDARVASPPSSGDSENETARAMDPAEIVLRELEETIALAEQLQGVEKNVLDEGQTEVAELCSAWERALALGLRPTSAAPVHDDSNGFLTVLEWLARGSGIAGDTARQCLSRESLGVHRASGQCRAWLRMHFVRNSLQQSVSLISQSPALCVATYGGESPLRVHADRVMALASRSDSLALSVSTEGAHLDAPGPFGVSLRTLSVQRRRSSAAAPAKRFEGPISAWDVWLGHMDRGLHRFVRRMERLSVRAPRHIPPTLLPFTEVRADPRGVALEEQSGDPSSSVYAVLAPRLALPEFALSSFRLIRRAASWPPGVCPGLALVSVQPEEEAVAWRVWRAEGSWDAWVADRETPPWAALEEAIRGAAARPTRAWLDRGDASSSHWVGESSTAAATGKPQWERPDEDQGRRHEEEAREEREEALRVQPAKVHAALSALHTWVKQIPGGVLCHDRWNVWMQCADLPHHEQDAWSQLASYDEDRSEEEEEEEEENDGEEEHDEQQHSDKAGDGDWHEEGSEEEEEEEGNDEGTEAASPGTAESAPTPRQAMADPSGEVPPFQLHRPRRRHASSVDSGSGHPLTPRVQNLRAMIADLPDVNRRLLAELIPSLGSAAQSNALAASWNNAMERDSQRLAQGKDSPVAPASLAHDYKRPTSHPSPELFVAVDAVAQRWAPALLPDPPASAMRPPPPPPPTSGALPPIRATRQGGAIDEDSDDDDTSSRGKPTEDVVLMTPNEEGVAEGSDLEESGGGTRRVENDPRRTARPQRSLSTSDILERGVAWLGSFWEAPRERPRASSHGEAAGSTAPVRATHRDRDRRVRLITTLLLHWPVILEPERRERRSAYRILAAQLRGFQGLATAGREPCDVRDMRVRSELRRMWSAGGLTGGSMEQFDPQSGAWAEIGWPLHPRGDGPTWSEWSLLTVRTLTRVAETWPETIALSRAHEWRWARVGAAAVAWAADSWTVRPLRRPDQQVDRQDVLGPLAMPNPGHVGPSPSRKLVKAKSAMDVLRSGDNAFAQEESDISHAEGCQMDPLEMRGGSVLHCALSWKGLWRVWARRVTRSFREADQSDSRPRRSSSRRITVIGNREANGLFAEVVGLALRRVAEEHKTSTVGPQQLRHAVHWALKTMDAVGVSDQPWSGRDVWARWMDKCSTSPGAPLRREHSMPVVGRHGLDLPGELESHGTRPIRWTGVEGSISMPASLAWALREYIPTALQGRLWHRAFSLMEHGASLPTLLQKCRGFHESVVVVRAATGERFGGFAADHWHHQRTFYGRGLSFVWTAEAERETEAWTVTVYPWQGANRNIQLATEDGFGMGGGGGGFAWYIDEELFHGTSGPSATFGNPPLVRGETAAGQKQTFRCTDLEVWALVRHAPQ